ncbi:hypothetical protein GCM10007216_20040 [Thalassobacillus devorans]|uniref:Uncharacterized protein n=1 Tax=Thalassobacillus devorans TaxID=279813 RepID=A0ABQ1P4M6_9BACI|nr:hypothetical protein [Thalassobacillus devorans]NIK28052.1 hypothetical protein [Thalassobacillus devorans]GGC89262.1 hypothetical protein GCM10007216_20040 [Thalassobacillus devorans]
MNKEEKERKRQELLKRYREKPSDKPIRWRTKERTMELMCKGPKLGPSRNSMKKREKKRKGICRFFKG